MAVVNPYHKFVFLCMPHTASRATTNALLKLEGSTRGPERLSHHAKMWQVEKWLPDIDFTNYAKFYCVRHPADWLVSRWILTGGQKKTFPQWVKCQNPHIFSKFKDCGASFIKFENIAEGVKLITGCDIDMERRESSHVTKNKGHWTDHWDTELANWSLRYFADFKRFSYNMDDVLQKER